MPTRRRSGESGSGYVYKFAAAAALLVVATLALVLYVLPERYVLSSGFREGALNLPTPAVPFRPAPPLRVSAIPDIPRFVPDTASGPYVVPRGPSELFWERVLPLLEAERWDQAIPLFTDYLTRYPGDIGVRREYAITLVAAGLPDRAVPILRELLEFEDDDDLHLLLARALRDQGRVAEASEHYRTVLERAPDDTALWLEWARALAWAGEYSPAEQVLREALEGDPTSVPLRAELARVHVYAGDLELARDLMATLTEDEIRAEQLGRLRDDVDGWLATPEVEPPPPPTTLELAARAREADEFERADSLYRAAVLERPDDAAAWQAYADFLQYELDDFEGALTALREVERLTETPDAALAYRMAQLELWTERTDDARARLEALLASLPDAQPRPAPDGSPSRADVLSLLGDLDRWTGARLAAVSRYEAALAAEPGHTAANEGLDAIAAEVDRQLVEGERPGIGAIASSFADTDSYRRYDAGGAWTGLHRAWTWSTRSGARRLEGFDVLGGEGSSQGVFAELEGARWWRWGTIRTGMHLGLQTVRDDGVDVAFGATARFLSGSGSGARTDLRFDHEPAYGALTTLQSAEADVRQDRFTVGHSRPVGERWNTAFSAEAASIDHRGVSGADRNLRLAVGSSVGRSMSRSLTLGVSARALSYRDAAPDVTAVSLYWDPRLNVSVGPYLQWTRPLGAAWELTGRLNPGVAYLDERVDGTSVVPEITGGFGLLHDGSRYRTSIELYYGQGRLDGYKSFGVDLSFSARGFFGPGIGR